MRVLFVYPLFPLPLDTGTKVRVFNLIKALKGQGHDVGLIGFIDCEPAREAGDFLAWLKDARLIRIGEARGWRWKWKRLSGVWPLLARGVPRAAAFCRHPEAQAALEELADGYDAVLIGFYFMGFNVTPELWRRARAKLFLVEDDVSFIPLARAAAVSPWPGKAVRMLRCLGGKRAETAMLGRFANILAMSEPDAGLIGRLAPRAWVGLSPNGVDCAGIPYRARPETPSGPPALLFVGGLGHRPNLDALRFFISEYWPEIRRRLPGTTLDIAGSAGPADAAPLRAEGVRLLGFVPDLTALYGRSLATVAPYRIGGGTRLKILEAMAAGLPVVSSAVGVEGLPVVPDRDFLLAESRGEYIEALTRLSGEPGLASRLARNARALVETRFDWPVLAARLIDSLAARIGREGKSCP